MAANTALEQMQLITFDTTEVVQWLEENRDPAEDTRLSGWVNTRVAVEVWKRATVGWELSQINTKKEINEI